MSYPVRLMYRSVDGRSECEHAIAKVPCMYQTIPIVPIYLCPCLYAHDVASLRLRPCQSTTNRNRDLVHGSEKLKKATGCLGQRCKRHYGNDASSMLYFPADVLQQDERGNSARLS